MNISNIAINGFFGRMGQTIYNLSIKDKEKFKVTVGCDQKDTEKEKRNKKVEIENLER
jgi:dihydrodipicolinate reductase